MMFPILSTCTMLALSKMVETAIPVYPMFASRAVEKVLSWLKREVSVWEDVRDSLDQKTQPFEEPDFTQHQLVAWMKMILLNL